MPEKPRLVKIKIADISIDGLQQRVKIDQSVIDDYAADIDALPPGDAVYDGIKYYLWDGHQRYFAHKKAGRDEMSLNITEGTFRDAVLASLSANANNGLRRTQEDKRKAVRVMLADPEWAQWSKRRIAETCRVSTDLVISMAAHLSETTGATESQPTDDADDPFDDDATAPSAPPVPSEVKEKAEKVNAAGGSAVVTSRTDPRTGKTTTYTQDTSKNKRTNADPNEPFAEFNAKMREGISHLRSARKIIADAFDVDPQTKQIRCKWAHYFGSTIVGTIGSGGLDKLIRQLEKGLPYRKSPKPPGFITKDTADVADAVVPKAA